MRFAFHSLFLLAFTFIGCDSPKAKKEISPSGNSTEQLPYLTFQKENLFPGDSSLLRPEDGVAFADGRVIVVDQAKGLRLINEDGSNRPFGKFTEVGFVHNPPENIAGPNGLFLEHDKQHLLMCDIGDGKIYRIDVASEKVELIYDHPFGVNAIYRDKTGAIWFTQSAKNTNMRQSLITLPPDGAVFRMAGLKSIPTKIADSLQLANGITMDQDEKTLFVAETMMNRVHSFDVDITSGKAKHSGVAAIVLAPDNILIDSTGRLIIASPCTSQVIAVDFKNHSQQVIFDASTIETQEIANEWFRRSQLGIQRADLITPKMYGPLPGLLTGMFFSPDGQTLYVTNLGDAILKLHFK